MAISEFSGPLVVSGDMTNLTAAFGGSSVPDPNPDAGPSMLFEGWGYPDTRFFFPKDQASGYTGAVPQHLVMPWLTTLVAVPAAHTTSFIAAAANTVSGTAMTLATTNVYGRAQGIPVSPFNGTASGAAAVTPAMCLDFGFCYGTTATNGNITVLDSTLFYPGMPLVLPAVGAGSGASTPLLTVVQSITSATVIVVSPKPLQALSVPIGTGNLFGPSENPNAWRAPTAHMPVYPRGAGLYWDPRQIISRGLVIVCNSASGAGGAFKITGYDDYCNLQHETITSTPASDTSQTIYGKKCWKWISSIIPQFTDPTYTYSVGTSDVIACPRRQDLPELTDLWWNGAYIAATTGFVAPDLNTATATTGCPRGTWQLSAVGGSASGVSSSATNGSVSTITISGLRVVLSQQQSFWNQLNDKISNTVPGYGPVPF